VAFEIEVLSARRYIFVLTRRNNESYRDDGEECHQP